MLKLFEKINLKRRMVAGLAAMHWYGNPSGKMKIVGVTGTNGKTTTTTLLYRLATALGYKAGLIGTVSNIIVDEEREALRTTPSPINLYKLLNEMAAKGCEYVFMEVSSHGLDQKRVAGIKFAGAIFTNLTHDHLDYHKSVENYFNAKKKLFKMLPTDSFALTNVDDEHGMQIVEGTKASVHTYGFDNKAEFSEKLETSLIGKFNEYNAVATYGGAVLLGWDKEKVKEVLKTIKPPHGRFEHFTHNGVIAVVDYAHTPDALKNVLSATKISFPGARIISVFGCGGDRDPLKRRIMGKIGAEESDIAIFTSDNPRSEDPNKIIDQMKTDLSMNLVAKVKTIPDRRQAIKEAVSLAKPGDIILCAGKGHETYQEIRGTKHHFDDMEELKKAFG
jgi:UDP-N-acetylmuramoyl-L-alanyl-D-glutamate--2,6-diaminopimelate ligase